MIQVEAFLSAHVVMEDRKPVDEFEKQKRIYFSIKLEKILVYVKKCCETCRRMTVSSGKNR